MKPKNLLLVMVILSAIVLMGCSNPVTPPTVINISEIPIRRKCESLTTETEQYTGTIGWSSYYYK